MHLINICHEDYQLLFDVQSTSKSPSFWECFIYISCYGEALLISWISVWSRLPPREGVQCKNSWLELEDVKNQSSSKGLLFSPPVIACVSTAHCVPTPLWVYSIFFSSLLYYLFFFFSWPWTGLLGVPPLTFMDSVSASQPWASLPTVNCSWLSMYPNSNSQEWELDRPSSPLVPDYIIGFYHRQSLDHANHSWPAIKHSCLRSLELWTEVLFIRSVSSVCLHSPNIIYIYT